MPYLRVVPYNDHDDATLTASAAPVTGYPEEDTQNDIRSRVYRSSGTSTVSITGVVTANRVANCFFLFRHTLAGANVRLQLYSDAGASAQVYDSTTLPAVWYTDSDAYTWSTGSNDPLVSEAPFRHYFTDTTYRSYKITFSGTPTYYSYFQVSRIVLGKYIEFARQPRFGLPLGFADNTDKTRSLGGSLRSNIGATWGTMTLDLGRVEDAERPFWVKMKRRNGTGRSWVLSLYPGNGTDLERDYTMLCKFVALDPIIRDMAVYTQRLQIEET